MYVEWTRYALLWSVTRDCFWLPRPKAALYSVSHLWLTCCFIFNCSCGLRFLVCDLSSMSTSRKPRTLHYFRKCSPTHFQSPNQSVPYTVPKVRIMKSKQKFIFQPPNIQSLTTTQTCIFFKAKPLLHNSVLAWAPASEGRPVNLALVAGCRCP